MMNVSIKDQFLVWFDRLFKSSGSCGNSDGSRLVDYRTNLGRKMIVLDEENQVVYLGRSLWVEHQYDKQGNFVRRIPIRKNIKPGWRVIYGHRKVHQAYDKYVQKYS